MLTVVVRESSKVKPTFLQVCSPCFSHKHRPSNLHVSCVEMSYVLFVHLKVNVLISSGSIVEATLTALYQLY